MARLVLVDENEPVKPKLVEVNADMGAEESNPAYKKGRSLPGALQGLASVMQGPTFGFADEIGGAVGGAYKTLTQPNLGLSDLVLGNKRKTFGENYRETRDMLRGAADAQQAENPWLTGITRGMASAPLMLIGGGAPAAAPISMASQAGRAGAIGAGTGALQGAGGSTSETLGGLALDAGVGGALGFGMSAASVPVARGMGGMYEQVASRASGGKAAQFAREKVAEAALRDARGSAVQANPDGAFQQLLARYSKLGPEARVVDAGGQNTRQLLDTLATLPGRTKDATEAAIRSRQVGRADRMIGAAERSLGTNGDRAAQVVDDLVRTRQQAATPLYGRLHQMEVQADPALAQTLAAAEQLGAGTVARNIATASEMPYSLSAAEWSASGGRLSMRDLDHMKQGIDTLIAKNTDAAGKVSPLGYRLQGLRDRLVSRLDEATGGFYKEARDAFAGPSALIDATTRGRRFMTADDASTRQALSGLSTSEQEAFRLGAFEALRNKVGRPGGQTEVLGMWKDKVLREKLQTIFPDERSFREFAATTAREARMKALESVGRGSQTASRLAGATDLDVPATIDAVQLLSGAGGVPGVMSGVSRFMGKVQTPEPVRDAMGGLLLSQGAAGRTGILGLDESLRRVHQNRMLESAGLGLLGGMGGGVGGGLLVP